jgi:glycosyltransferase involved in cell wall biosynthesis
VIIEIELVAYGTNVGREIQFTLGEEHVYITPEEKPESYRLTFNPQKDADIIKITNLDLTHAPGARDHRSLGIGLTSMTMMRPEGYTKAGRNSLLDSIRNLYRVAKGKLESGSKTEGNKLELNGVIYTCVMNPQDGRKNWEDMVTAFCWAFRNEPNVTLVLKMTHNNLATFLGKLLLLYSQMSPFKCRVVAVHGFLTDEQYQALMDNTHYVVNCSHCEGQCLPLMEFMGQGIPAIAPDHTAMADYINEGNAFVVKSSLYPTFWPFDERRAFRTMCYRIDWNSLKDAFARSFEIVTNEEEAYMALRIGSIQSVLDTAGQDVVHRKMKEYLSATAEKSIESAAI